MARDIKKMKKYRKGNNFSVSDIELAEASANPTYKTGERPLSPKGVMIMNAAKKIAKQREEGGKVSQTDIDLAKKMLKNREAGSTVKKKKGGVIKAGKGTLVVDTLAGLVAKLNKLQKSYNKGSKKGMKKLDDNFNKKFGTNDPKKRGPKGKMAGGMMKKYNEGGLKDVPANKQKSLGQLPTGVRNNMGFKMSGGMMQYNEGTGKKGVTVQSRGCGAVISKRKTKVT